MITDSDIKKMKKVFVTKEEFGKEKIDIRKELKSTENFLSYRIDSLEKKVDDFKKEFTSFKDSVLKTLDWLVGAFKKFDEEHTVLSQQNQRTTSQLENHEARIKNLEKRPAFQ